MSNLAAAPLTHREAMDLTGRIKTAANNLWQLLLEAHERKAWKALSYPTWEAYVKAEFDMSRSNAYRLLDQGRVTRAIEEAGGNVPHAGQITQRDVDAIKPVLPEVAEEIRNRVEQGADPVETTYEVIEAKRAERKKTPEPSPEPEDEESDLLTELEHAHAEMQRQERMIKSLSSSDLGQELADWQQRYAQLNGRLNQQITTANEAKKQAQYYSGVLKKIRRALNVQKTSEIIPRIQELTGGAI